MRVITFIRSSDVYMLVNLVQKNFTTVRNVLRAVNILQCVHEKHPFFA